MALIRSVAALAGLLIAFEATMAITVWPSMAEGGPGFPAPAFGHGAGPFGFSYAAQALGKRQVNTEQVPPVAQIHNMTGAMVTDMPMVVPTHVTPTPAAAAPVQQQPTQPTVTPAPGDLVY
ncbi:hypothetical protein AAVH_28551 [Aphelenchoides avenae]|nr:hypothetical protein AAVH_28551 [Aphelenchus avenae]